jgi:acyl-CoA thioesterase FadM
VTTAATQIKRASATLRQIVLRGDQALFAADVQIACMDASGAPVRIPEAALAALRRLGAEG